ncbi:MAG: bifunctional precorrin-2 dehydrogenase/sirohydrochlorin ferrochelatase [Sphingobium sp.]|nr:bifunctional precorrin-2 dehydrogenase/sirohydrochlorin ferrochelatase [Sphingobium sp.]
MHSLPLFVKIDGQPVILAGEGEAAQAKRRLIERAGGIPIGEDDPRAASARIAFIALDAPEEVAARLKAAGKLVNVVDRPELCDFTTPAIVDRDPVIVAIGTGGASSGLAAALRQRLEDMLPSGLGALANALKAAREAMRARWPDDGERRRALSRALAPGGQVDPLGAEPDVQRWLDSPPDTPAALTLVIRPPSTDPDDLNVAEARALGMADRIVCPPETPPALLARARADAHRLTHHAGMPIPEAPGLTVVIDIAII